jgi:ABC-type lipoprotein export system ATPase subunit
LEVTNAGPTGDVVVHAEDVFKIYGSDGDKTVALRGADLVLRDGEFVALLGRSGSGKSTLLQLIAGLDTPSAGKVFVGGQDISHLDEEERAAIRRKTVGLVLQRDNLVPYLSAAENVALPLHLANHPAPQDRARTLLERVGLSQRLHHRASQLSGGEAQRVSVAVALTNEPRLLIGDEVTGELDSQTASSLLDLLCNLHDREGMSLLVVTHDAAVARRAERIVTMRDGVIEGSKT